ncbi:hypothetical protein E3J62_02360 [candidate division TA06 bacterium]|uniref:Uncharacterized protein n=1 Tax=candidate division TA06 bacterium TaxID=2250710 RepID=A0A523UX86_UNCT6|nr:MAG: hypothetical protein E3J62_02360 [candidate division TA06 bacterium]
MPVEYINRSGDTYYLHRGKTRTSKPKYFFSKKDDGVLVRTIPEGYEIYEHPNARVFLRRSSPKIFADEEISIVENGVRDFAKLQHFKIDIKKNQIIVFIVDQDVDSLKRLLSSSWGHSDSRVEEGLIRMLTYSPMMRFVLTDETRRIFDVERMCFLEPMGWMFLDGGNSLRKLVKKYCYHLGKDSFFELI